MSEPTGQPPTHPLAGVITITADATVIRADGTTDEET
jgi:hypothetical protein